MPIAEDLAPLLLDVPPVSPSTTINDAADLFLSPAYERLLSIPIVDAGRPVGSISRFQLNQIFMRRYGRELHGRRPVSSTMNEQPLLVDAAQGLDAAAQFVAANISAPMREDFILVDDGRYLGVGIVLDLLRAMERRVAANTEQLAHAYRQLQASQAQLVQSEKMASLGQMVAGVAHEINTPLGYVRNNIEMMESVFSQMRDVIAEFETLAAMFAGEPSEAQISEQLVAASTAAAELRDGGVLDDAAALIKDTLYGADQIREIVVSLKDFSRLDQARTAEVSLNECLDQTLVIARNVIKNRAEVVKRYGEIPPIACSPSQLNQVFLNLLANAAHAIEHDRGQIVLKTESDARSVHVSVQDNGKGIAEEHLGRIFDPFFTTKPVGQGTGLGLSIAFQIVKAHGGSIRVASQVGRGTRFVVSLPRIIAQASGVAA